MTELRLTLCQLGRVARLEELGQRGPLLASAGAESLFHCLFGRDAIRMAFDLLDDFPTVARVTLLELARLQGVIERPRAEEEPGRILHEHREVDDPLRPELERLWTFPYFGAVDSTPQWINLLAAYTARAGDAILDAEIVDRRGEQVTLFDSLLAALGWILGRLDDPFGGCYLWVRRATPDGIANQVWEDSGDSYYHADGTIFDFTYPYAPVAVQGYAYDALLGAAEILARRQARAEEPRACEGRKSEDRPVLRSPESANAGDQERGLRADDLESSAQAMLQWPELHPDALRARAGDLRARFLRDFWQPDLGTFALALTFDAPEGPEASSPVAESDAGRLRGRPARVVASSPGHLLASRLLDGDDAAPLRERLVSRLFEPDLLAGAGIRTRSTGAARFRAGSYHNGSTWPMDTGVIADGLRRHGLADLADELEGRILAACAKVGGFPELFRGDPDGSIAVNTATVDQIVEGVLNRLEQPPQPNQGWTATRVWSILARRLRQTEA